MLQLVKHLAMYGSPRGARYYLVQYNDVSPTALTVRVKLEWQAPEMDLGEAPLVFLSRANFVRHKGQFFFSLSDSEANRHYARELSSDLERQRGMLLTMPEMGNKSPKRTKRRRSHSWDRTDAG